MTESFINKEGILPEYLNSAIEQFLNNTLDKLISISWKSVKPTRSLLQNKYYWGVVIKMLSAEIGYEPEMMHEYMKDEFLPKTSYGMPDGHDFIRTLSTTTLSTKDFDWYIQKIRIWADNFLSLNIPLPNQTQFNYTGYE